MSENFPIFAKDIILQIQEAEWIQNTSIPKHITVGLLKTKESGKDFKSSKETTAGPRGVNDSNENRFLIRNHNVLEVGRHCLSVQ